MRILALLVLLMTHTASASADNTEPDAPLPPGGVDLLADQSADRWHAGRASETNRVTTERGDDAADADPPFTIVQETLAPDLSWWQAQSFIQPNVQLDAGRATLFEFEGRTLFSTDESQTVEVTAYVQLGEPPWTKPLQQDVILTPEWQTYRLAFNPELTLAPGTCDVGFGIARHRSKAAFRNVRLYQFPEDVAVSELPAIRVSYGGREPDAAWRAAADARIRAWRTRPVRFQVPDLASQAEPENKTDAAIQPATILRVEQLRSPFMFGTAIASGVVSVPPEWQIERGWNYPEDVKARYRELALSLSNTVTIENGLKWRNPDPTWEPGLSMTLNWIRHHGLDLRGHTAVWASQFLPSTVREQFGDPERLNATVFDRTRRVVASTRGVAVAWDVVNEPRKNWDLFQAMAGEEPTGDDTPESQRSPESFAAFCEVHRVAHEADPDVALILNDYGILTGPHTDNHARRARAMLDAGTPLHGLGVQGHFAAQPPAIDKLIRCFDTLSELGLPVTITELDITTDDESLQADFTRDLLTLAYSHPACNGVMLWGFWEGAHWRPKGALYRKDFTAKPVAHAWHEAIRAYDRAETTVVIGPGDAPPELMLHHGRYRATLTRGTDVRTVDFTVAPTPEQAAIAASDAPLPAPAPLDVPLSE